MFQNIWIITLEYNKYYIRLTEDNELNMFCLITMDSSLKLLQAVVMVFYNVHANRL